jgi:uncharacterized protein YciI
MFIISLKYMVPIERIEQSLDDHRKFLKKYYDNHTFLMSGPKSPRDGGVILLNADSLQLVEQIIQEDPFWQKKLAKYEIIEFTPSMTHDRLLFLQGV